MHIHTHIHIRKAGLMASIILKTNKTKKDIDKSAIELSFKGYWLDSLSCLSHLQPTVDQVCLLPTCPPLLSLSCFSHPIPPLVRFVPLGAFFPIGGVRRRVGNCTVCPPCVWRRLVGSGRWGVKRERQLKRLGNKSWAVRAGQGRQGRQGGPSWTRLRKTNSPAIKEAQPPPLLCSIFIF